jgi:hypothetical protein
MNTLPTSTPGSGNVNKERGPDDVRVEADHDECNRDVSTATGILCVSHRR